MQMNSMSYHSYIVKSLLRGTCVYIYIYICPQSILDNWLRLIQDRLNSKFSCPRSSGGAIFLSSLMPILSIIFILSCLITRLEYYWGGLLSGCTFNASRDVVFPSFILSLVSWELELGMSSSHSLHLIMQMVILFAPAHGLSPIFEI